MICYVLTMGKHHFGPHVVVGYGIKIFWPGPFITSPDHLVPVVLWLHSHLSSNKTYLTQFCLYFLVFFLQTRLFTEEFPGRLLSIRVFSADGHY